MKRRRSEIPALIEALAEILRKPMPGMDRETVRLQYVRLLERENENG